MGALDLHADLVELASAPAPMAPSAALREMAYRADAWTPQETDRLRVLFAADAALADIAAEIGRGRAAVAERVTLLGLRSEEHTSELQSLMRISYAVFCLKKQ